MCGTGEAALDAVLDKDGAAVGGDSVTYGKGLGDGWSECWSPGRGVAVGLVGIMRCFLENKVLAREWQKHQ